MSFWQLCLIAVGVSADAFAVALGKGLHMRHLRYRNALIIAVTFGLFQAIMPLIGWLLGTRFADYITDYDHWIIFALLALVGGKMLWEAFSSHEDTEKDSDSIDVRELLVLAIATSLDALAVGVSFAGILIGHRVGIRLGKPAEIAGGVILILIGLRILFEHLGIF